MHDNVSTALYNHSYIKNQSNDIYDIFFLLCFTCLKYTGNGDCDSGVEPVSCYLKVTSLFPQVCKSECPVGAFSRRCCPKRFTVINTCMHTLMAAAAMQSADQHIRNCYGVQYLAQGHFDMHSKGIEPATFR